MRRTTLALALASLCACGSHSHFAATAADPDPSDGDTMMSPDVGMASDTTPTTAATADPTGEEPTTGATGDTDTACDDEDDGCQIGEACGPDGSGNGLDDDCDGHVDEECACTPGDVRACFAAAPGRRGVGACEDGTMRCMGAELGAWSECMGGIAPTDEVCDGLDNDCDGCPEELDGCEAPGMLECPAPGDLPAGSPFVDYVIDGTSFYDGPFQSWAWTVTGGPCDELLLETSGVTSYTLSGADTPALTLHPTLSGDYTVEMEVTLADGTVLSCSFVVHVRAPGLRVELCWDTTGDTDLDLHLHRPGTTTEWSADNPDDCGYHTCSASANLYFVPADWDLPPSDLDACIGTYDGAGWSELGYCSNPRLDIDNVMSAGVPENINVDVPQDGGTHRIMVHYFSGSVPTHPIVNVYCGGTLVSTHGAAPDPIAGFDVGAETTGAPRWRVADVTTTTVDGETVCDVQALHPPGREDGAWVDHGNSDY